MNDLKFSEAWNLWRKDGKTLTGVPITVGLLISLAFKGIISSVVSFLTTKVLNWIWNWAGKSKEGK